LRVWQARRLALACCLQERLGTEVRCIQDMDVIQHIGQFVVAQSLVTRAEAAEQLAVAQRARILRHESILPGTVVHFSKRGDGVYVGRAHSTRHLHDGYSFCFGEGEDAEVFAVYPAMMESEEWSVQPGSKLELSMSCP
jgi:hypothetical protein